MNQYKAKSKKVMLDPGDMYALPEDVLKDETLSEEEKRKILKNWSDEIQHLLESGAENMLPDKNFSSEEELLQQISKALESSNKKQEI